MMSKKLPTMIGVQNLTNSAKISSQGGEKFLTMICHKVLAMVGDKVLTMIGDKVQIMIDDKVL